MLVLESVMENPGYSINITAPVLMQSKNIDFKETIKLIKRQEGERKLKPEIKVKIPKPKIFF